ncbi:MAG: PQQ-binding-like beta-propeller repeat protein [Planctomycetota bacterium]
MPRIRLSAKTFVLLMLSVSTLVGADLAGAADWPQWRGPTRDGQSVGQEWPDSLQEDRLQLLWRTELGPSYSGPIVSGTGVFTTETQDEATEVVTAYDRQTGERLWRTEWPGAMTVPFFAAANGSWIRATPACDGETLYVLGIRDVLVALDVATGDERWRIDFPATMGVEPPKFGAASSPMVADGHVYVQAGNALQKIDGQSGEIVWTAAKGQGRRSDGAFSSPYFSDVDGEPLVVVQTREALKGIDPESGAERWSQPIQAFRGMNILTPVVYRDRLFTSAHSGRSQLWRVSATPSDAPASDAENADPGNLNQPLGLAELWSNKSQAYMSSPVVVDGHLYLHLKNQRVQCLNLETGEETWRSQPRGKYQSMVVGGDRILTLDSGGELILFHASPDAYTELDRRRVSDDETWAHLAVCGGQVFVRELNALAAYAWK